MTVRIYADFNYQDELGLVVLNTEGALQDIERQREVLRPGISAVLYTDESDYVEVAAILQYDVEHGVWLGEWRETER